MRVYVFDHDEFDCPDSEQRLVVVSSHMKSFASRQGFFIASCTHEELGPGGRSSIEGLDCRRLGQLQYAASLTALLADLCNVLVTGAEPAVIVTEDWNEQDYVLEVAYRYYRYLWTTSS